MTREEVRRLIRQTGLRPATAAGQHFLLDEEVVASMVSAAGVGEGDTVLEIGPGFGVLTQALLNAGAEVVAVELDQRLVNYLQQRFRGEKRLTIIPGDIFKVNIPEVFNDRPYHLVANLPYSATSLVLRNFLTLSPQPEQLVVMIQKEVAERVTAEPGAMSLLSVMAQYYSTPAYLFEVPKTSFYPAPAVTSAVIACTDIHQPDSDEVKRVFRLAKAAFAGKRKQLHNTLQSFAGTSPEELDKKLKKTGISPTARPQELGVDDWRRLAKNLL